MELSRPLLTRGRHSRPRIPADAPISTACTRARARIWICHQMPPHIQMTPLYEKDEAFLAIFPEKWLIMADGDEEE